MMNGNITNLLKGFKYINMTQNNKFLEVAITANTIYKNILCIKTKMYVFM